MLQIKEKQNLITDKSQLLEIFYSGFKTKQEIGLELEKIAVYKDSGLAVNYQDIAKVLNCFDKKLWSQYYENGNLLGLKSDIGAISLEPGSQLEISLEPEESINRINEIIINYKKHLDEISENLNIKFLNLGIQPKSTFKKMKIIPKQRYEAMSAYLPNKGDLALVMMRETAGIQVSLDYENEKDAVRKFSLALKLSPIISAVFANSSIRDSKLNKYKSFRANTWLKTDNNRCGLVSKKLFEDSENYTFADYTETLLDVPMISIERDENTVPLKITFREFMKNGYKDYQATIEDWHTHLSFYFPDVRLKSYIEIRNHDSQSLELIPAVPAFWKGVLYNEDAISKCENLFKNFTYKDFKKIRENTPRQGINYSINDFAIKDIAKKLLEISYKSLANKKNSEEKYLEPIIKLINEDLTPADILISKWKNDWKNNIDIMLQDKYVNL